MRLSGQIREIWFLQLPSSLEWARWWSGAPEAAKARTEHFTRRTIRGIGGCEWPLRSEKYASSNWLAP